MNNYDQKEKRVLTYLIILYSVFAVGISILGVKYYYGQKQNLRNDFVKELTTISELKSSEITQWRKERLNNGNVFYKNDLLTEHIKEYFNNKDAALNKKEIDTWLKKVQDVDDIETVFLLDSNLMKRIVVPENNERDKAFIAQNNYDSLKSGKIVFEDFFRYEEKQKIYLKVLVPVFDNLDTTKFIGVVQVRIDPDIYLYPIINSWPSPSETAETVILRGEGDDVVFLNELKFQKNTALKLRTPMEKNDFVAVKALKGQTGIVDGLDYNGDEVIADIKPITNSPWIMVSRMDKVEVFAPLKEIFWWLVFTISGIIFMVGLILFVFWREQRTRFLQEQYKSTEALRQSEARFRLLYENSPVPYQSLDEGGNLIEVNNAFLEQLGYTYQEVIGHHISDFLVEEDINLLKERFSKFKKTGDLHDAEFRFKHKNGNVITISVNGKIGYDINGEFTQTHCVLHNITERKIAEDALKGSEERFRMLFDKAPLGYQSLDIDGNFIDVNQEWIDTLGYKREEVIGKWFGDFLAPDFKDAFRERFPIFKANGEIHSEFQMKHKNGQFLFIAFDGRTGNNLDGTFKQTHCILKDITEQRRAEEALKDSEEKFRKVFEEGSVGMAMADFETGRLFNVNNAFCKMLGYTKEELLQLTFVDVTHPDDREKDIEAVRKMREGEIQEYNLEKQYVKKNGELIWATRVLTSVSSTDGKSKYALAMIQDITERKQAEQELLESERLLKESQSIARLGSFNWNIKTGIWESSNILDDIFGIDEKYERTLEGWLKLIHPDWQKTMNDYINNEILGKHNRFDKEYKIIRQVDGKECWVHGLAELEVDKNDNPVILIGTISDITERKKAEHEIIKLNRVYKVLSNVNQMIVRAANTDEILKEACNIAVTDGEFRIVWVGAVNKETNKLEVYTSSGTTTDNFNEIKIDLNDELQSGGPSGRSIKSGMHYVCNNIENDESMIPWRENARKIGYKSSASFPIKIFGITAYTFTLYSNEVNFFDEDELKLLDELVMDVSFALEFAEREKERRNAEESLRVSEQKYKDIFVNAPVGIYQSTREGKILNANSRLAEMLGYDSIEELIKLEMHKDIYFDDEEREKLISKFKAAGKVDNIEIKWKKKNGTPIWISLNSHIYYKDDEQLYFEGFVRDITIRKQHEESLKASEEKYRNLIETMPEGFYRSTPEGYFVDANPALVKLLGYDNKEEIMKAYIPETFYFTEEERENEGNIDFISDTEVYRLKKKDGTEIWVDDHARYIKDESGKVLFHEGIMRDITQSLHAQKAIIEAKDKAEEMSRLKSSFLANMSHEIRTPLNGILGFAELLKNEIKEEENLKHVKVIEKGGKRLLETLDLILNFSKLEAEMVSAKYKEVNVGKVIEEVVDHFEAMAKNKSLSIEKTINYKNLVTKIDERFLRHSISNLLKNAIVYTNKGGITVTFDKDEKDMIITVKDTGIGIAKENYEMIFEPFRQESEGWGRNFEGTGLGLSITKRFVEMMKGKVEVESEVGVGSTFTVRIPFLEDGGINTSEIKKPEPLKTKTTTQVSKKGKLSILLVENDEANRQFTLAVLDRHYKTDYAVDGYGAIEKAKNNTYDIILMDINLGKDIDGIMTTQEIRKLNTYKETPIVALTAFVREGDKEEFLAGGCSHYLGKPFTVKQLLNLIEEIIA